MGSQGANTYATGEEAAREHFATFDKLLSLVRDTYQVDYDFEIIFSDAYLTTINGLIAARTLPDMFNTREVISDSTLNNLAFNGTLAKVDDVLEHANAAKELYNTEGKLQYLKAYAQMEDGNWYYVPLPNTTAASFNFGTPSYPCQRTGQIHGAYAVCVRQDWLDKIGMAMPASTDEFLQALKAFQEQDVNGSGAAEERYIGLLGSNFQTSGVGQWFGLPYTDWVEDPSTGAIEVSCLTDGYKEFLQYSNTLYANNLMYVEGTHPWGNATLIGGNNIAAIGMMPSNLQFWSTGDPDGFYMPMPPVKAVENVMPRVLVQESQAAFVGFSFAAGCDYEAAGRMMDFLVDRDTFMTFRYGIEGKAWDYSPDGKSIVTYELTEDELYSYGSAQTYWLGNSCFPINGGHHGNLWGLPNVTYSDFDAALNANEPYYEMGFNTIEGWKQAYPQAKEGVINGAEAVLRQLRDFGKDNYRPTAYYSYTTMSTNDEADILMQYETELKTYLQEMTTNVIIGSESVDGIDEKIQFAFDNLGLKEYYNVMQSRVNRYRSATGEPVADLMP